jgi:hypothetical protein
MSDSIDKNCKRMSFGLNLFTHVTFLFIILGLFFLIYASKIIDIAVNSHFSNFVEKFIYNNSNKVDEDSITLISLLSGNTINESLTNLSTYFSQADKSRYKHNKNISNSIFTIMIFLVLIIIIIYAINKIFGCDVKIKNILGENIIIFTFVGIIEILFFLFIIKKYIPIKPSFLSVYLKESLTRHLS